MSQNPGNKEASQPNTSDFDFQKRRSSPLFVLSITSMEQRLEIRTEEKKTILKNANKLQHRQDKSKRQLIKAQKEKFDF